MLKKMVLKTFVFALAVMVLLSFSAFASTSTSIDVVDGDPAADSIALDWPNETCSVIVTNLTAGDNVTIIVFVDSDNDGDLSEVTASDILYIKQAAAVDTSYSFDFQLRDIDYTSNLDKIKVAVGSDNVGVLAPQYAAITVAYPDEISSISVDWSSLDGGIVAGVTTYASLPITINYASGSTATINANDSAISVTGFDIGEAGTYPDANVSLATLNNGTKSASTKAYVKSTADATPVASNQTLSFNPDNTESADVKTGLDIYGNLKLPEAPAVAKPAESDENYAFLGWSTTSGIYQAGKSYAYQSGDTSFTGKWIDVGALSTMKPVGAASNVSLRVHNAPYGIRYSFMLDDTMYEDVCEAMNGAESVTYGAIICPKSYLSSVEDFTIDALTAAGKSFQKVVCKHFALKEFALTDKVTELTPIAEGSPIDYFNCALVNIKAKNLTKTFVGRGFICVKYQDDSMKYFYTNFNEGDYISTVKQLAQAAYDTTDNDAVKAILAANFEAN